MSTVTKVYTFTNGTKADATEVNKDFDDIYSAINGNLGAANLANGIQKSINGIINVQDPAYNTSGLATTFTGSITSGTKALTLTATPDFVQGQGINLQGALEASSLQVTAAATVSSNITVTLNGVAFLVAVVNGDTAIQVATKIRAATYTGWTVGGTAGTDTITFISTTSGVKTDSTYSAGTTGATGTMTTTTQGTADQISTVSSVSGLVVNIADNATRTIAAGMILHDDTSAIVSARDNAIAAKAILFIPQGTYNVSSLSLNSSLNIVGAGIGKTILQSTNGGNLFLQIAGTASVENVRLQDLSIYGGNTDTGGVAFGTTAAYYVAFCIFERVEIRNFTAANAYGVSLNRSQEIHFIDCKIDYNYDNIYRPSGGYVTTCAFSGQAGYIGRALRYGAYINDILNSSIKFIDQIIEENASNAIYSPAGTKCIIVFKNSYFEGNNSSAGTATIDIGGSSADAYSQSSLILDGCEFHASANPALPVLKLDRVMWRANNNSGLMNQTITTTANTKGILIGNGIQGDAINYKAVIEALLGSHGAIENTVVNGLEFIGNLNFTTGITIAQITGVSNGIQMPHIGIGASPHATRQILISDTDPIIQMYDSDGTANKRKYEIRAIGASGFEGLQLRLESDDESTRQVLMNFMANGSNGFGGTGSTVPNANSIMDFSSNNTTKAVLFPVMTTTQKNAITAVAGMVVYDSSLGKLCVYTGAAWQTITSA